ncbi:hypothetical protein J6590_061103 [Homalodisca vitripennis]|nr:hypothetical protein J6590_061103 [Homalodisca vitripennis]
MLLATLLFINGARIVGSMPSAGTPENITVMFLSPTAVKVSWTTSIEHVEKYDVTYKPTDASYRVVAVVAGNSDSVTLSGLLADTQYQITVTAVRDGKKFKSRPIVFRTLVRVFLMSKRYKELIQSFFFNDLLGSLQANVTPDSRRSELELNFIHMNLTEVKNIHGDVLEIQGHVWIAVFKTAIFGCQSCKDGSCTVRWRK